MFFFCRRVLLPILCVYMLLLLRCHCFVSLVAFILSVGQFGIEIETMQKRGEWSSYYTYDSLIFSLSLSSYLLYVIYCCADVDDEAKCDDDTEISVHDNTHIGIKMLFFCQRKKGTHKMEKTKHTYTCIYSR